MAGDAEAVQLIRAEERAASVIPPRETLVKRLRAEFMRDRLIQVSVIYLVLVLIVAVFGPVFFGGLATQADIADRFLPPLSFHAGWQYVLGADAIGRSFLAQLVVATRTTLIISVCAVLAVAVIGSLLGAVVGYVGGFADQVAMRVADVMLAFPTLLLALIVLYTLPAGIPTLIFVLAVTRLAVYVRVARSDTLVVRQRLFVRASRALGAGPAHIIGRQILPVIAPTMGVLATLEFALMILAESSLSFLGIGVQPPNVTWGLLIAEGSNYLLSAWWVALLPGIAITSTALSVNLLADWFRRAGEPS
jgi:peptide/nickel transport system permease protein